MYRQYNGPLCSHCSESPDHLFQCTQSFIQAFRQKKLKALYYLLSELDTDPLLSRHTKHMILHWTNGFNVTALPYTPEQPEAYHAINEQIRLGVGTML